MHGQNHIKYVSRTAFPFKQWLNERPCVLSYTHIACLVEDHGLVGHYTLRFD